MVQKMRIGTEFRSISQRVKFLSSLIYNPRFYRIISDVVSDPSKLDSTLGTLCYFTLFLSVIIKRYPHWKAQIWTIWIRVLALYNTSLDRITAKAQNKGINLQFFRINPSKVKEFEKQPNAEESQNTGEQANRLGRVLKQFSGYISDIRIFNRGFSIPSCIADVLEAGSFLGEKDYLNFVSTWCISLYQPFETVAFLLDHNWLMPDREDNNCNWWYAVSTRFWFVWVIAEFSQLSHKLLVTKRCKNVEKTELITFLEHLATLPLCVHWSLEEGCLDEFSVGLFGTIAGGLTTLDLWRETWATIAKECR